MSLGKPRPCRPQSTQQEAAGSSLTAKLQTETLIPAALCSVQHEAEAGMKAADELHPAALHGPGKQAAAYLFSSCTSSDCKCCSFLWAAASCSSSPGEDNCCSCKRSSRALGRNRIRASAHNLRAEFAEPRKATSTALEFSGTQSTAAAGTCATAGKATGCLTAPAQLLPG